MAEALRPRAAQQTGRFDRAAPQAPPPPAEGPQRTPHGKRVPHGTERAHKAAGKPAKSDTPEKRPSANRRQQRARNVRRQPPNPGTPEKRPSSNRRHQRVRNVRRQLPNSGHLKSGRRQPAPPKRPQKPQAAAEPGRSRKAAAPDAHERPAPSVLRQPHPPAPPLGAAILNRKRTGAPAEGGLRRREIRTL